MTARLCAACWLITTAQDMHYAEFGEDEVGLLLHSEWPVYPNVRMLTPGNQSAALLAAIKEYDTNKWKVIGQKVGKPAKVGSIRRVASA